MQRLIIVDLNDHYIKWQHLATDGNLLNNVNDIKVVINGIIGSFVFSHFVLQMLPVGQKDQY